MANFTAKDVQALRTLTGVGMMECKKALVESEGDLEKAVLILREKGLAAAQKKAGRIAAEGIVATIVSDDVAVIVEVNAETDFVAQNKDFVSFVDAIAQTIVKESPQDVEALLTKTLHGESVTVQEALQEKILVIGENMNIRRFARSQGIVETYLHGGGRIGVLVRFESDKNVSEIPEFRDLAKDVAMQIAAVAPQYISKEEVPAEAVAAEKAFLVEQVVNEGKPAAIAEKIVEGRIGKFFEQICLLEQSFIKDGSVSVGQHLANVGKELGATLNVVEYYRYEVGEGIEKKEENFADEVAGMMK